MSYCSGPSWWPSNRPLPPFPAVVRDLSLVVARALQWAELCETVVAAAGPTLETVRYLDTFQGGNIPDDKQSVHFSMVFRHPERTLTGEEVERAVKSVVEACEARFRRQAAYAERRRARRSRTVRRLAW